MSDILILALRWAHVLGACVLIGTGAGIAFFMLMAHRTGDARVIAAVARIVPGRSSSSSLPLRANWRSRRRASLMWRVPSSWLSS